MIRKLKTLRQRLTTRRADDKARRQTALLRLSADLAATLEEDEICQRVVQGLHDTLDYDVLALMLVDETTGNRVLATSVGYDEPVTPLPPGRGLSELPLLDGQLHYTPDVSRDHRYFYGKGGSEVDVPVRIGGKVLGVLIAENWRPRAFSPDDFEVLTAAAQQAGLAIEKARLLAAERRRADELDALRTTMSEITAELEQPALLQAIVERAAGLLGATGGELGLYDEDKQQLHVVVSHNLGADYVGTRHELGEGAMGRVAQTGEPLVIEDYSQWAGGLPQYGQVHATVAVPLVIGGRLVGVFTTASADPSQRFTPADLHLLNLFGQQAAIAINNARLYNQAQREIAERTRAEHELRQYQEHLEELVANRTAELQESEERYRSLFDGVPVGLYRTTPGGQIIDANVAQVQMLGYPSREKLLAISPAQLYSDPAERARWQDLMEREGVVRGFETRFHRYDGSVIWVRDTARAVKDAQGRVLHYEGSIEDITERKHAEAKLHKYQEHLEEVVDARTAELRKSEERYRTLFDRVPVGLYRSTPAGQALDYNRAAAQMLGYKDPEALFDVDVDGLYVNAQDRERWQSLMRQEGIVRDFETQLYKKDGSIIWINDAARAVKDEQEQVLYYEGSIEDITERKHAEEEILHQKEYYEALLINNPVAVVTADLNGMIVSWNPMAEKLFGYAQEEVIGTSLDDVVANDESLREEACAYTDQVINVGRVQVTTRRTRRDGSLVDVELLALPAIVGGVKVGFIAIYHDITERKRIEKELRQQKEYYEALFVNSPVAVATVDLDCNVVTWNPTAERLFGYSQEEVIGQNLDDLVGSDPSIWEETRTYTQQVLTLGRVQATTQRTRKDGSLVDVEVLALPVIVGEEVVGIIGIYIDIGDLQEARRQAEAANQAKSAFLANMSHELRTPLNAILGFTQLMTGSANLTSEQEENLEVINRSGEYLLTLINDVLEMSKIEAGQLTLREGVFDLHHLLRDLEQMFRLRADAKGLELCFVVADGVPRYVQSDEGKLRQALSNLLGNAVKFTQAGSVVLRVTAPSSSMKTATLQFEVEDTGPGIVPEDLESVFDPFVQASAGDGSQEGSGLGLSISRQFVRMMGGDLSVISEPGKGSTFRLDILAGLVRPDASEIRATRPGRRVLGLEPGQRAPDGSRFRLLVTEDRKTNRHLLIQLLEPVGFEVRGAANGQEALDLWADWKPHLIWMDMRMPIMDGYEATRRIKATLEGQSTVIVALTAFAFKEDRERILAGGCDDIVSKPFRADEIFHMLTKHLDVRFVYQTQIGPDMTGPPPPDVHTSLERVVPHEALAELPSPWLAAMREAIVKADLNQILGLVSQIQDRNPALADVLEDIIYDFEYKKLLALVEQAGGEQ